MILSLKGSYQRLQDAIKDKPQDYQAKATKEFLRQIYTKDLFYFTQKLLGYDLLTEKTHRPICNLLEDKTVKRKMIVVPRGCFKSTICTVAYPIWKLLNDPNERIMIDSELYENSSKFLREIKAHLTSEKMTKLFGKLEGFPWNESEATIATRTKHYKESSIISSGYGSSRTGNHFSTIVADDLNTPKNSMTPEACQKVIDHYRMYTSLLEPDGEIVIVGTRYSSLDVIGYVLDNSDFEMLQS